MHIPLSLLHITPLQSLHFELTNIASVLEIPGLYDMLNKAILSYVSDYFVLPNMLTFSLSDAVDQAMLKTVEPRVGSHRLLIAVSLAVSRSMTDCVSPRRFWRYIWWRLVT